MPASFVLRTAALPILILLASAYGAEERYTRAAPSAGKMVPFALKIEQKQYQELLDQLPESRIAINKEAIVKDVAAALGREGVVPAEGRTLENVAQEIYAGKILPVLEPRVEAFNDLLKSAPAKDSVSGGFLAFPGLAKGMAEDQRIVSLRPAGQYWHGENGFDRGGRWEWYFKNDQAIADVKSFRRSLVGKIDENIKIELDPYGKAGGITWKCSCKGSVTIEQTFGCALLGEESPEGAPVTSIRVRPNARVVVLMEISPSEFFKNAGDNRHEVRKTFDYPAVLEIEMAAERPADG